MKIIYKIILLSVIYLAVINGQSDIDNAVKYNLELNRKVLQGNDELLPPLL